MASRIGDVGLDDVAETILVFLNTCEDGGAQNSSQIQKIDGVIPADFGDQPISQSRGQPGFIINEGAPAIWPLRVAIAHRALEGWENGSIGILSARTIPSKEARIAGVNRFSRYMARFDAATLLPSGLVQGAGNYMSYLGGKWLWSSSSIEDDAWDSSRMMEFLCGISLMMRYEWSVWIGYETGPRVRFVTDPSGAMAAFKLRDLPPGRTRRAALRHWVSEHWRRKRAGGEAERIWVSEHLRGAQDFVWNGLRCRIDPPAYEIERLALEAAA